MFPKFAPSISPSMSVIKSVVSFLFVSLFIVGTYSCKHTANDYGCDDPVGEPSLFAVVSHDTQSVFTDSTQVPQIYYFKNGNKNYISDVSLSSVTAGYKYRFAVTSLQLGKVGIDSNVSSFYLQRSGGIIDTLNFSFNKVCANDYGINSLSAVNGVSFYDISVTPYIWVFREN